MLLFVWPCRELRTLVLVFFFQAEDGIRDGRVTGVQTCALPICDGRVSAMVINGDLNMISCLTFVNGSDCNRGRGGGIGIQQIYGGESSICASKPHNPCFVATIQEELAHGIAHIRVFRQTAKGLAVVCKAKNVYCLIDRTTGRYSCKRGD